MGMLLILYIGTIGAINMITPKRVFSESENRKLEQMPELSLNQLFEGRFTLNYEKYISDQFALRDFWIGVKSDAERLIKKNESNGVFLGKDGYLIQGFNKPDDKISRERIAAINSFSASTPGLNKYFMVIPNPVKILEDKLPAYAPVDDELEYVNKIKDSVDKNIKFVNVYDTLYSKKDEYIFYRTDHHWTTDGAYYAYEKLAQEMGFNPHDKSYFDINKVTDSFYGSLYSKGGFRHIKPDDIKLYMPKVEEVCQVDYIGENKTSNSLYNMDNLNNKDKYTVFLDGNHSLIKISTNTSNNKKLLVFKDSYANSLIPFLTGHYSEIYVVDLRYCDEDISKLTKDNNIKDMLVLYNVNTFFEDSSFNNISEIKASIESDKGSEITTEPQNKINNESVVTPTENAIAEKEIPEDSYKNTFRQDVFMGDSITEGLSFYEFLDESNVCAKIGININNAGIEVDEASKINPKNIFLLFGVNDMDETMTSQYYSTLYANLIHQIKFNLPEANIYVQSILPVLPIVEEKRPYISNGRIEEFNSALKEMTAQESVNFINIEAVLNEDNRDLYEGDGIHFKSDFYPLWLNYVVENVYKK